MTESPSSKNYALITGASSGIGRDLTHCFAADGWSVILTARRETQLQHLAQEVSSKYGISAQVLAGDLSDPKTPEELFKSCESQCWEVGALVNNAGFGNYGTFHESDLQKELSLIQVNITALTHLCKLFIQPMISRQRGYILNVGSTAGFQPGPLMAVYYASKAYVVHFSEAIANELKDFGIHVSVLCPGPTQTEFVEQAGMEGSKLFKSMHVMDSSSVAQAGYDGLMTGKTVVIPGLMNKLTVQSNRISPRKWVTKVVRQIQERSH